MAVYCLSYHTFVQLKILEVIVNHSYMLSHAHYIPKCIFNNHIQTNNISYVPDWCSENYLNLNVTKTNEMILDMRKKQNSKTPVTISNSSVAVVSSYKYLGVIIQDNLKWKEHVEAQTKKAKKRMYNVRRLKKLKIPVDSKILCLFYNSVISSVLSLAGMRPAIKNYKDQLQNSMIKCAKITDVSVHESIEQPSNVYITKCKSLITKIVNDHDHSMHKYITVLPHGNLRVVKGKTERLRTTFLPVAIKLYNVK